LTKEGTKHETVLTMFSKLRQAGRTELIPAGGIFASLAYGEGNLAEHTWLERVLQDMYDIVQETPLYQSWTKEAREEGRKEGIEEGLEKGRLEGKIETLLNIVRARFPRVVSLAKAEAAKIDDPDVLDGLILKVSAAKNAKEARRYLRGEDEEEAE